MGVPDGGVKEGTEGAEGVCSPVGGATVSTSQTPPPLELPGTGPPTKEYTWKDPWFQPHMWQKMDGLVGHQWEERPLGLRVFDAPV